MRTYTVFRRLFLFVTLLLAAWSLPFAAAAQAPLEWRLQGTHSYEAQSPGLGVSSRFASSAGWVDVYVYDMRRTDWQNGTSDPQFAAHFDGTVNEVRYYGQQGRYGNLQLGTPHDVVIAGQPFRTVLFTFSLDGRAMQSMTYLTVRDGKLLKYRMSLFAAAGVEPEQTAREFIEQNLQAGSTGTKI